MEKIMPLCGKCRGKHGLGMAPSEGFTLLPPSPESWGWLCTSTGGIWSPWLQGQLSRAVALMPLLPGVVVPDGEFPAVPMSWWLSQTSRAG